MFDASGYDFNSGGIPVSAGNIVLALLCLHDNGETRRLKTWDMPEIQACYFN